MSDPFLPPELFDHIVDHLHEQPETLRQCCLVSKSWIPRVRTHLFGEIIFRHSFHVQAWKNTFPDPTNSPAYYTLALSFSSMSAITDMFAEGDGFIRAFHNVTRLSLRCDSAHQSSTFRVLSLICSLPHLQDLNFVKIRNVDENDDDIGFQPVTSPPLTGTLTAYQPREVGLFLPRLLGLPNGARFRQLVCVRGKAVDCQWMTTLLDACSDTLEHADLELRVYEDLPSTASIDFSKATKLKSVVLWSDGPFITWVTTALETITSGHTDFRAVSIHISFSNNPWFSYNPPHIRGIAGERERSEWMRLDCLLDQLYESRGIRVMVLFHATRVLREILTDTGDLLPRMTKRGNVGVVDCDRLPA